MGACRAVLSDGLVTEPEAQFLLEWLQSNQALRTTWPFSELWGRLGEMLVDGHLDDAEQGELLDLLVQLTSGPLGAVRSATASTSLPLDDPAPHVEFFGMRFCLTGQFITGPRREIESITAELGGLIDDRPTLKTDFLVIGIIASADWIHSTWGRKIERAVELRDSRGGIAIISEELWHAAVPPPTG